MTAMPLVPLGQPARVAATAPARKRADLRGLDLPTDPNGLLMHAPAGRGSIVAPTHGGARLVGRLDYGAR
jgi:hypothetical protein